MKPEEPLITSEDIKDQPIVELEEYAKNFCKRFDVTIQPTAKFLPHRTIKSTNAEKVCSRKKGKNWEVTAATPPPPVHGDTKLVSLQESIRLQSEQHIKLQVNESSMIKINTPS